jgi:hypothetical protein
MSVLAVAPPPVRTEPAASRPQPGYLQRRLPVYLILGSFVFLTLPLAAVALLNPAFLARTHLGLAYVAVFGTTHFVLTLTIYLQSSNLRYFNSTWTRRVCYFLVPVSIFVFFDLYRTLQVAVLWPVFDLLVRHGIRLFDFHHFGRQNYGMLQLFKGRSRCPFPGWARKAESGYFLGLTALLMLTFLGGGRFDASGWETRLVLECVGCLLLVVAAGFIWAWRKAADRSALAAPLAYFLLQTGSAALGIYSSSLYLFCLAMHYVEYHVVMVPRCFATPLDATSRTDRVFRRLRQNRVLFYLGLLAVAAVVTYCTWITMGAVLAVTAQASSRPYLALIALFDGLFVFHYFIEAFIWKFSDPYYRQTLGPLYFGQRPKQA